MSEHSEKFVVGFDSFDGVFIAALKSEPDNILGTGATAEQAVNSALDWINR